MKTLFAIALVSFSAMTAACTATTADSSASSDDALSAGKKLSVVGTFVNDGNDADSLIFYAFTFRADGTYSAQGGCKPGPSGDHCFAIVDAQGTYKTSLTDGATEIVLTDSFKQETRYFVSISGNKLSLCSEPKGEASVFTKGDGTESPTDAIVGSFSNDPSQHNSLVFYGFSFNADGTYVANGGCRPNPVGPSCFAIIRQTGTWASMTSGPELGAPQGAPKLVLTTSGGDKVEYFYTLDGKTLSITTELDGEASIFTKS